MSKEKGKEPAMRVRWDQVGPLVLFFVFLVIVMKNMGAIASWFESVKYIGSENAPTPKQLEGIIFLLLPVAVFFLLYNTRRR